MKANLQIVNKKMLLIDRARRAYLRRSDYKGVAPVIADCRIILHHGRDVVELRDGEVVLAAYSMKPNGELKYECVEGRHQ